MIQGLLTALQTIIFYILVVIPAEYYLTVKTCILNNLDSKTKTFIFIGVFVLVFLINQFLIKKTKKYWLIITFLFFLSLFSYYKYDQFYSRLQQFPKICTISDNWSIQGKKIIIEGKNFGSVNDKSYVQVSDIKFLINQWNDEKIVVTQPMLTEFGKTYLYVYRGDNQKRSNKISFELRDPATLNN